jgi:type IV secretion system protein VirB11
MSAVAATLRRGVYLDAHLAPFARWLDGDDVTEILVNRPREVWIEQAGRFGMQRHDAPAIDDQLLERLAQQIARETHQGINRERPLLAATLPGGARVQIIAPPATTGHWAMSIRRHRQIVVPLSAYARGAVDARAAQGWRDAAAMADPMADPVGFLQRAVAERATVLISGGTSSGKTTFLNALLREVPPHERIILVEDTPEIRIDHANCLGLVAVKGDLGEAKVAVGDLLQAALRMRPDRIVLGELRGSEAVSFLRAINTGHPGSFSTIHANSPKGALEHLALMVMQTGLGLSLAETMRYAKSMIDVVVQLDRSGGVRLISDVMVN